MRRPSRYSDRDRSDVELFAWLALVGFLSTLLLSALAGALP